MAKTATGAAKSAPSATAMQINLRLAPELLERLDHWCAKQRPKVTRTAVLEAAVEDFLSSRDGAST